MHRLLFPLFALTLFGHTALAQSETAAAATPPLVDQALAAVGCKDKLLKIFRMGETFHFGNTPEPAAGKTRSSRTSVIEQPDLW